jgi:uncharacterized membrane protein
VSRFAAGAFLALGLGASSYLTYVHYTGGRVACPTSGCERVQESFYATPHGVPISLAGALLFLALGGLLVLRRQRLRALETGIALAGAIVAVYLIGVQLLSLHATCIWCLTSDVALVIVASIAVVRLIHERPPTHAGARTATGAQGASRR